MTTQTNGEPPADDLSDAISQDQEALEQQEPQDPNTIELRAIRQDLTSLRRELRTNQGANSRTQDMIRRLELRLEEGVQQQRQAEARSKILASVPEEERAQVERYLTEMTDHREEPRPSQPDRNDTPTADENLRAYFQSAVNWVRQQGVDYSTVPTETWSLLTRQGYKQEENEAEFAEAVLEIKNTPQGQAPRGFMASRQPQRRSRNPQSSPAQGSVSPPVNSRPGSAPAAPGRAPRDDLDKLIREAQGRDRG